MQCRVTFYNERKEDERHCPPVLLGLKVSPLTRIKQAEGHGQSARGRDPEAAEQGEIKMSAAAKTEDKFMF